MLKQLMRAYNGEVTQFHVHYIPWFETGSDYETSSLICDAYYGTPYHWLMKILTPPITIQKLSIFTISVITHRSCIQATKRLFRSHESFFYISSGYKTKDYKYRRLWDEVFHEPLYQPLEHVNSTGYPILVLAAIWPTKWGVLSGSTSWTTHCAVMLQTRNCINSHIYGLIMFNFHFFTVLIEYIYIYKCGGFTFKLEFIYVSGFGRFNQQRSSPTGNSRFGLWAINQRSSPTGNSLLSRYLGD